MSEPQISAHFLSKSPSAIRLSQIEFAKRKDGVQAISTAIGDVSLPMHPAMQERMFHLSAKDCPLKNGVVGYTESVGAQEAREAFLNVIRASNCDTAGLQVQITDGGSQAMELVVLGCCGPSGTGEKPLMVIDPAYTNYIALCARTGRKIVSISRKLEDNEKFSLPDMDEIRRKMDETRPGALVVIPYDNPTGQFYTHEMMVALARLCVEKNMWMISDEAYRELHYTGQPSSSIWRITEKEVQGITGRRISIESASKVWNGCGLRIGALVTDNQKYHEQSVAESTANLCSDAIGQYIFGALARLSVKELQKWFDRQREYYKPLMFELTANLKRRLPGILVSSPDASIYSVVDVRNIAGPDFNAKDFSLYCAREGVVEINGKKLTLLTAPMAGFYNLPPDQPNPGRTQMRIAYVCPPDEMKLVPELFEKLFKAFTG